ncbi:MAG: hypothetical protein AAGF79_05445 [Pseudomonadota bacterium]
MENLLVTCAEARPGDRLLIAYEPADLGYFDADILRDVTDGARRLGLQVHAVDVGFSPRAPQLPEDFLDRLAQTDVVLFLARLGDQLRFSDMPAGPTFVVCFALNSQLLGSRFGTADYRAFVDLKQAVDRRLLAAQRVVVTCPAGTHVEGAAATGTQNLDDTTSRRFPMSVFSPVPAAGFSGRVALGGFLTGTGSQYYDGYTVTFDGQVFAHLEAGRLTGFSGAAGDVAKANAQYDRVSSLFGIDRDFVHSWHAGLHPGCGFPWPMRSHFERWGGAAFGNPRVLHFHTCGAYAPGEISWNLFDPTISVDGVALWENGRFYPDRLPEGAEILARFPSAAAAFATPDREVGLGDAS